MHDAMRNYETLPGLELHRSVFKVDQQFALDHIKEFVVIIMLVPVIFALNDPDPDN